MSACDYLELANPGVRGLQAYQPGKPIEELQRELGLHEVIKLASNENPLGPGDKARAAIAASIGDLGRYPDGNGFVLKTALADVLGVDMACLTLGNGSNDVLDLIVRSFVDTEHEVIFAEHAFAVYALTTRAVGARAVVVPAVDWGHDLEAMAAAVTERSRVLFVANPNNPTGTWSDQDAIGRLLDSVPANVLVVIDEAYLGYVDEPDYPDCVSLLDRYPNLIVTRSFSKIHGLAGLRVGYCVSNPVVADVLNRVRQPFNVNSVAMAAATAALTDAVHIQRSAALNHTEMARLTTAFDRLGLAYVPSVGNFVSLDVGADADAVNNKLLQQGVIVRPIAGYGMPRHLRVTVGVAAENERFVAALETALA